MPQPLARRSGPLRPRPVLEEPAPSPLSAWLLNGPLTAAFGLVAVLQLVTWLPHYLTWPYWADHDVFAHAARAWSRGALPYRDTPLNNFPGTIYLFLILGKAFGWGRPPAFFAFDAGLLLLLGATLAVWSKRRFGSLLPAAVGWLTWTSTYLSLDMAHAAQRDWQGPAFAVLGLLLLQTRRSPGACVAAGLLAAVAFSIRPQTILLMPAAWAMLIADGDGPPLRQGRSRRIGLWAAGLAAGLAAVFAPLLVAGVFGDFIQGVRLAAYGGGYNRVTPVGFVRNWFLQAAVWRWWALALASGMIARLGGSATTRLATPWLVALAGVSLYKPVSPVAHSYLELPIELVAAVCTALLVGLLLVAPVRREVQVAGILLALGLGPTTLRPEFCVAGPTSRALAGELKAEEKGAVPPGYRKGTVATLAFYPWDDYRALLDYLSSKTDPTTPVANLLMGDPAVVSAVDRPSAIPAESIAWLRMVRPQDEQRFADELLRRDNAVVVWVPDEVGPDPAFRIPRLTAAVRQNFRPVARFGSIEVWERRTRP